MRILHPLAFALPLAVALGACTTWRTQPAPAPSSESFLGGPVRVTRVDGAVLALNGVTIGADSVVGRARTGDRVALPTAEVRRVEARRGDPMGTVAMVLVPLIAAGALWGAIGASRIGTKY